MNDVLLQMENVGLAYGPRRVLTGVNLSVTRGDLLLLAGPNGGGKTTLLRLMAGLLRPSEGRVAKSSGVVTGYLPQYRRIDRRFPITVAEVVRSGLHCRKSLFRPFGKADGVAVRNLLDEMELAPLADRPIEALSGGQWQRVLLARALAGNPDILLLDEPDTHLDAENRERLYTIVEQRRTTSAVVLVSHDLTAATRLKNAVIWAVEGGCARLESEIGL